MTTYVGLIGGGNITETHAKAARAIPGVKIAAIYGSNPNKIHRLCKEYGGTPYHDFEDFLAHGPMELVMIGSPSGLHATQGIAAAQRGLHILTEKPIDIGTAHADALIEAAEKAKVKLGVIFQDRTKSNIVRLKKWMEQGVLGKILFVDARMKWFRPKEYYSGSKWRGTLALDGGGALMNQGIHTADLLLWLFGDVASVQAQSATAIHSIEVEDTVAAILRFASGALGTLHATTAAYPGYPRRIEITGENGTIILEQDRIVVADLRDETKQKYPEVSANNRGDANASASSAVVSDFHGHQTVLEDLIHAIRDNRSPICDGREGRRSVALVEAIYAAARNSTAVDLPYPR